jgi:hypothetical protein
MMKTHLQKTGMTYTKHFFVSFKLSKLFLKSSYFAFVHAIFPNIYTTSSSDAVKHVEKILSKSANLSKIIKKQENLTCKKS